MSFIVFIVKIILLLSSFSRIESSLFLIVEVIQLHPLSSVQLHTGEVVQLQSSVLLQAHRWLMSDSME